MEKFIQSIITILKAVGIKVDDKEQELIKKLTEAAKEVEPAKSEDEIRREVEAELKKKNNPEDKTKTGGDDKDETIAALQNQIDDMSSILKEMKEDRDAGLKATKKKLQEDKDKKVAELKKKGIGEGRITEATWKEKFQKLAEENPDAFEALLPSLAVDPHFKPGKSQSTGEGNEQDSYRGPLNGADKDIVKAIEEMNN